MGEESNFRCQPKYICPYQFIGCCGSCHHYPFRPVIPQDKNGEAYCMSFLTSSCMICVGFGLTSALLCIKIFFFPFSRTDSQTPNLSQYVLLISHNISIYGIRQCVKMKISILMRGTSKAYGYWESSIQSIIGKIKVAGL